MVFETTGTAEAFLLARLLFAGILGIMGLTNLLNAGEMQGYAAAKGVPLPGLLVPLGSATLVLGAASVALGAFPLVGAVAVAGFLVTTTLVMHDFWSLEGEQAQDELIQFLKNVGLLGGALVFGALASVEWPYALGASLF
jgi:uncharacterized membrane protein YphA (DoxX/SURF4 family)